MVLALVWSRFWVLLGFLNEKEKMMLKKFSLKKLSPSLFEGGTLNRSQCSCARAWSNLMSSPAAKQIALMSQTRVEIATAK